MREVWAAGTEYETYLGRWSRLVAERFVPWVGVPAGRRRLEEGCGTGALSSAIRATGGVVTGVDPSLGFLAGRQNVVAGDARSLPFTSGRFDAVVSGLALNFVPDPTRALAEQVRMSTPGATVAAYVRDYAEGMAMMRLFWDAALDLDPDTPDEGVRFPLCQPEPLAALWRAAGLTEVTVAALEVPTVFPTFDDYWRPFLAVRAPRPPTWPPEHQPSATPSATSSEAASPTATST